MKILALIPARSGSKRIPNKNIHPLCGKPLMRWTVDFAVSNGLFDEVVVSSDSEEYLRMAERWGAIPIIREPELANDSAGDYEVIKHATGFFPQMDLIAYLRPTTPFREKHVVMEAINFLKEKDASSLRSVERMTESAFKCFTMDCGFLVPIGPRDVSDSPSQTVESTFHPNGYVDLIRAEIVIDLGLLWGSRKAGFLTRPAIELDEPQDFEYAEWWYERRRHGIL